MARKKMVNSRASNGVLGVAASTAPALSREGLVIVGAQVHAVACPCVEVALGGYSAAAGPLALPVADVLSEGGCADNRGLVDLGVLPDVIDGAIASNGADFGALSGSGAVAGIFLDVVLNKRVLSPAVD